MQPVRLFMVMSNSLLSLPKRMGQVAPDYAMLVSLP